MSIALVGIGSNIYPEKHLADAAIEIKKQFSDVCFSNVYQSEPVGMEGENFLNACCLIRNAPDRGALIDWFKSLEDKHGRDRSEGSWKPRTLDLDLLMYDKEILDDDLSRYPHVYVPASELIDIEMPVYEAGAVLKVELRL